MMKAHSKCGIIYKTLLLKQKSVDYLIYPIGSIRSWSAFWYNCAVDQCLFLTVQIVQFINAGFVVSQLISKFISPDNSTLSAVTLNQQTLSRPAWYCMTLGFASEMLLSYRL